MVAVDGHRVVAERPAAVGHDGPGRVDGENRVGDLPLLALVGVHIRAVAEEVDQVDISELVLHRPDLDARVVPLAPDLRDELVADVPQKVELDLRPAVPPADRRVLLGELVADRLAVEGAVAADDDPAAVEEVERLVGREAHPARGLAPLPRRGQPHQALVALAVLLQPGLLRRHRTDRVAPEMPDDPVEGELRPLDPPLAEAERGLGGVDRRPVHHQGRPEPVEIRLVGPPEFGVGPGGSQVDDRLAPGGDLEGLRREGLLDPAGCLGDDLPADLARGFPGRRVRDRDLGRDLLPRDRRLDEDVRRVDRSGRDEGGRRQDARLRRGPDRIGEVLKPLAEELLREVERLPELHRVIGICRPAVPGVRGCRPRPRCGRAGSPSTRRPGSARRGSCRSRSRPR